MGSRTRFNPVDCADPWQYLRAILIAYDLVVGDHPSDLASELFDEALVCARHGCHEDVVLDDDEGDPEPA